MSQHIEMAAELIDAAVACCVADISQEPDLIYKTWRVIANLPEAVRMTVLPGFPTAVEFARLMRVGAYESAAIRLLGSNTGFLASKSPGGAHLATVNFPGVEEITISANSLALGLSAGLLTALGASGVSTTTRATAPAFAMLN